MAFPEVVVSEEGSGCWFFNFQVDKLTSEEDGRI